jgi:hypothetical protein
METINFYELLGYSASVLVALSLSMRSLLKLRVINLSGAMLFTVYGLVIGALPVAALNFFIVLVNIYYLYQMFSASTVNHQS